MKESTILQKSIIIILFVLSLGACATKDLTPKEIQEKRAELIKRCKELKKDIDDLKGSPIRRNAAIQYYDDECNARTDAGFYQ